MSRHQYSATPYCYYMHEDGSKRMAPEASGASPGVLISAGTNPTGCLSWRGSLKGSSGCVNIKSCGLRTRPISKCVPQTTFDEIPWSSGGYHWRYCSFVELNPIKLGEKGVGSFCRKETPKHSLRVAKQPISHRSAHLTVDSHLVGALSATPTFEGHHFTRPTKAPFSNHRGQCNIIATSPEDVCIAGGTLTNRHQFSTFDILSSLSN